MRKVVYIRTPHHVLCIAEMTEAGDLQHEGEGGRAAVRAMMLGIRGGTEIMADRPLVGVAADRVPPYATHPTNDQAAKVTVVASQPGTRVLCGLWRRDRAELEKFLPADLAAELVADGNGQPFEIKLERAYVRKYDTATMKPAEDGPPAGDPTEIVPNAKLDELRRSGA